MFERLEYLIDEKQLDKIFKTRILLVGVGGVGGAALEALVRMGILNITIVDDDIFTESNLNRQIICTRDNIGCVKVVEAEKRAKKINPDINIETKKCFLGENNIDEIEFTKYDYIIDCCDTMTTKLLLIKKAIEYDIKIISSMGTGNRLDATKLTITDIWETSYDPVAKAMRQLLRKNGIDKKITVVVSLEQPIKIHNRVPGSTSLVPNVAGFYIASYIFNDIIGSRE